MKLTPQQALVMLNGGLPFAVASRLNVIVGDDEDLRQTLMLALCVAASLYDGRVAFSTFAWEVVRRELLGYLGSRRNAAKYDLDWLSRATAGAEPGPTPERIAEFRELERLFSARIEKLDRRQRDIANVGVSTQMRGNDLELATGLKRDTLLRLKKETKAALQPLRKLLT